MNVLIIIYIILALLGIATPQTRRPITSTSTSEQPPADLRFFFDDVDWHLHDDAAQVETKNCFGEYIDCIRMTNPLHGVCAYDKTDRRYYNFYNICDLEIRNCHYRAEQDERAKKKRIMQKIVGFFVDPFYRNVEDFGFNRFYHNGEAYACEHYYRRAKNREEMDKLYFEDSMEIMERFIEPKKNMKSVLEPINSGLVPAPLLEDA